jgi:Nif-specific regulatory protein/two-component system response regulator HydG
MLKLLRTVVQVAASEATVLLLGETGTGKELVARALHWNSPRKARPFVQLHVTALPGTLLESELFGHVRGAYTGADRDRAGRIASAEGGTLFLDEAGELPPEVQAKLLRFLQFGEIQRLGSDRVERVRTRVVAATHRDLGALVQSGRFRQDLYFRLKVLELRIPPLRERKGDVALLAAHFLQRHWKAPGSPARFTQRAQAALEAHAWPGNVRELEHAVERACLLAAGSELDADLLPAELHVPASAAPGRFRDYTNAELKTARAAAIAEVEREFLDGLMQRAGGNASQAARAAGLQRTYLHELLARYGAGTAPGPAAQRRSGKTHRQAGGAASVPDA